MNTFDVQLEMNTYRLLLLNALILCRSADLCTSTGVPARHFIVTIPSGQRFICCVTTIDLDPKQFNKIPFYHEEDESVVKHYVENAVRS